MAVLVTAAGVWAQPGSRGHEYHESKGPAGKSAVLTGCLGQDETANYILTEANTGVRYTVTGPFSLNKHTNREVKLTGVIHYDTSGHDILEVDGIQDVAQACSK